MGLIFRLFGRTVQRELAQASSWEPSLLEAVQKKLASNSLRPPGFDGMTFAFSGTDGKDYYTWQDHSEMPACRQKQAERAFAFAGAGIGEKTLEDLCEKGEIANMNHLKATKPDERSKFASRVAFILNEIRLRPKEVIPEEVFYDFVCTMAVRKDEDPRIFDTVIHGQKIEMISSAAKGGFEFFMALPILRKYLQSSLTTEERFIELLSDWAAQRNRKTAIRIAYAK